MSKKSKLDRLAHKLHLWLRVVYYLLRIANEFADFVSKAVNYVRTFRKLQPLV
jgi:hypothetical protein